MKKIIVLLAFLLIYNIAGADIKEINNEILFISLDKPFEIKIRQTAQLDNEKFSVEFLELIENSLCPENSVCKWEEVAIIRVKVINEQSENEYLLAHRPGKQSYKDIPRTEITGNYKIQFLSFKQDSALLKVFKET